MVEYNFDTYKKMDEEDVQGLLHMRRRAFAQKNKKRIDREQVREEDKRDYDEYRGRD